jgi:hypothetical protein
MSYLLLFVLFYSCKKEMIETEGNVEMVGDTVIFDFKGNTGFEGVSFKSDTPIETVSYPDWLTVIKTGDTGTQTFHLVASENLSGDVRTGNVYLKWHVTEIRKNVKYTTNNNYMRPVEQLAE